MDRAVFWTVALLTIGLKGEFRVLDVVYDFIICFFVWLKIVPIGES